MKAVAAVKEGVQEKLRRRECDAGRIGSTSLMPGAENESER